MAWKDDCKQPGPKQVAIVIPAHMGSTRFPGKPLAEARGMPLLQWAWNTACECKLAGTCLVATDSQEIHDWCESHQIRCLFDPRTPYPTGSDRCYSATGKLRGIHYVVNLQCDEPELTGADLDILISELWHNKIRLVTTFAFSVKDGAKEYKDQNAVKVVTDRKLQAMYFTRAPLRGSRIHVGVYAYRMKALQSFAYAQQSRLEKMESLEQLRLLDLGLPVHVLDIGRRVASINTPNDLDRWNLDDMETSTSELSALG